MSQMKPQIKGTNPSSEHMHAKPK